MKCWLASAMAICSLAVQPASAVISVRDDGGNLVTLTSPAQRIVTLAPHVTELVYAAGAGSRIVGTVSYSDFPEAARAIPRIGNSRQIDIERLVSLKPDLLVVWLHGNAERQLEPLRKLGIPLFYSEPRTLRDVPETLQRLGMLFGTEKEAKQSADEFSARLGKLASRYAAKPPVRVFYQVWDRPLYTLSNRHIVGDAIRLCGGVNIFGGLPVPAPTVTMEAVILENPEAILSGQTGKQASDRLEAWKRYPAIAAVRHGSLFTVDADLLSRPGPRIINGAAALCDKLETVRAKRAQGPRP